MTNTSAGLTPEHIHSQQNVFSISDSQQTRRGIKVLKSSEESVYRIPTPIDQPVGRMRRAKSLPPVSRQLPADLVDHSHVRPIPPQAMTEMQDQALKDIKSIQRNYDQLKSAKQAISDRSNALKKLVQEQPVVIVPKVIIGAGDMGTTLWLEKYKYAHNTSDSRIGRDEIPKVLMLANDTGKWKHNYTLAQPHSLLEREPGLTSPSAFVQAETHHKNKYVNARHLYQANLMNLAATEAPVLLDSSVMAIEKRESHPDPGDWKDAHCAYRLKVAFSEQGGAKDVYVYTNEVEVAAGLGAPREIFPSNYITKELHDALTVFDPNKQCTPIIDGNTFMLKTQEEQTSQPRTVLVYGGGGNATACYAKACFGTDIRSEVDHGARVNAYAQANPNRTVLWFSRDGFENAGVGTLAKQAINNAKTNHAIYPGVLHRIEYNNKTNKLIVYMEIVEGTYEKQQITPREEDLANRQVKIFWEFNQKENKYVRKKCLGFECDQFVSSVGQDSTKLRETVSELGPLKLHTTKGGTVTGIASQDDHIRFFGAAASSMNDAALVPYNKNTREWIIKQNICADAEWPGVMPPSRAQVRLEALDTGGPLPKHINAMLDDVDLCRQLLKKADVSDMVNEAFLQELIAIRKSSSSGASKMEIMNLIRKYKLENKIGCTGHNFIYQITNARLRLVWG